MEQPTPTYEEQDLERIVIRDFSSVDASEVVRILCIYGTGQWQREHLRVRMACLKLANGNIEELERYIELACQDYRDVLASAEYSAYMRAENPVQKSRAIESDWEELQIWLRRA